MNRANAIEFFHCCHNFYARFKQNYLPVVISLGFDLGVYARTKIGNELCIMLVEGIYIYIIYLALGEFST